MNNIRKWMTVLLVGSLSAVGGGVLAAQPAAAANGNVWINFSSIMCPSGGSVVGVYWAVDSLSSGPASGDWGDNVIYPTVRIGASSTISFQLFCKKWGWYTYRAGAGQKVLSPYKSGLSYTYSSYF
jgi:hypothetical protein